jgi:hypothetical protein
MAGLDPATQAFFELSPWRRLDGRVKPCHGEREKCGFRLRANAPLGLWQLPKMVDKIVNAQPFFRIGLAGD